MALFKRVTASIKKAFSDKEIDEQDAVKKEKELKKAAKKAADTLKKEASDNRSDAK